MDYYGPRERLRDKGGVSLSDEELLSLLLHVGPRSGVAERLLRRAGSLGAVFALSGEEMRAVPGVGPVRAGVLAGARELAARLWRRPDATGRRPIDSSAAAYAAMSDLAAEAQETVRVALLNSQHQLIRQVTVFRGTLTATLAQPREILREALRADAAKIIVGHNHPSQNPEPSAEDIAFTEKMERAARNLGVPLLDHLIVCLGGKYFSFREAGLMRSAPPRRTGARIPCAPPRENPSRSGGSS